MKNRNVEFFNLSFLDLLSGALAAIIFLFIIVPKGEITLHDQPVTVTYDNHQKKFYGSIPDSVADKQPGDTLLAIVGNIESIPLADASPKEPEKPERSTPKPKEPTKRQTPKKEKMEFPKIKVAASKLRGSKPDVPCMLSIEMKWDNKKDNIDLYVCKDNACVYGGKRYRSFIGYWDSGKARTRLFGGDLRTNQEAVRQFDEIIPGTYDVYAQYKESEDPKPDIPVRLLVYTKNDKSVERGNEHHFNLSINPSDRTRIARVNVGPDGEIEFQSFK